MLAIYFTYGNVRFHVTLAIHLTPSSPLPMSISLFSMSVSPLLPCKYVLQDHFSRFRIFLNNSYVADRRRKWQPTPVFLPGESQGQKSLVGCCLWGHTESGTTEAMQQKQQLVADKQVHLLSGYSLSDTETSTVFYSMLMKTLRYILYVNLITIKDV